jgi:two-component system sensor histidine kinase PilS (NtrC family)
MNKETQKIKTLIIFRVIVAAFLIASFFFHARTAEIFRYPRLLLFLTIGIFVLTILYILTLKLLTKRFHKIHAYFQSITDVFIITFFIFITGGIESWFTFLLPINVIGSGIILGKHAGFITAALSSIIYGVAIEMQFYGMIPIYFDNSLKFHDFFYNIFANILSLFLITFLSRYLIVKQENTLKKLQEKETDFLDLFSLHSEILQNIKSGLIYTKISGTIILVNLAAEQILELSDDLILGKNLDKIFLFIKYPITIGNYKTTLEFENRQKVIDLNISEHIDQDHILKGYIIVIQDITIISEMELQIKKKERLAAIGELSANIAHEIRNPLAALKSSIEMLKEGKTSGLNAVRLMDIAISEMDRLNKIITNFLTYSSPGAMNFTEFSLINILNDTLDMIEPTSSTNNIIKIVRNFNQDIIIKGDMDRLIQVFWNLSLNAQQSISSGGQLEVSVQKAGGYVKISFKDTGIGILESDLEKIFYPFYTTKPKGTGLGLAMVYRTIEDHAGSISVKSIVGKGTTFVVTLPIGI